MSKIQFWKDNYRICPSCRKTNISEDKQCQDCRHNGDAYGTTVFTCMDCGWSTSFLYDEADTPYFYETRNYGKIDDTPYVPTPDRQIGAYIKSKYVQLRIYASNETMYDVMSDDGFAIHIIRDFLDETPATVTETPTRLCLPQSEDKWIAQKLRSAGIVTEIERSSTNENEPQQAEQHTKKHTGIGGRPQPRPPRQQSTQPSVSSHAEAKKWTPGAIWR